MVLSHDDSIISLITHTDGSRGSRGFTGVCLFVCLFVCLSVYPRDISRTDSARITKLDTEMF